MALPVPGSNIGFFKAGGKTSTPHEEQKTKPRAMRIMRRPLHFYVKQLLFCQAKVLVESFEGHEWALELTVWADFR